MSFLARCILLSLFTWLTFIDKYCTQLYTYRPVVCGGIVGLIMGDFSIGLQVGCIIELMFLGQVFVGTALPPEETFSTILAAAFACISGSTEVALATAIPLAILGQFGMYLRNIVLCGWTGARLDKAVENMDRKGIKLNCLILPNIFNLILFAVPVFLAVYFGADVVQSIIDFIPTTIINGINAAGGMIGAVGLALLLASLNFKNLWAFFALGFFVASYLGINQIGCTVVAAIVVVLTYMIDEQIKVVKGEH